MRTISEPHLKFQVPIHGQRVGKQISFGVLILYASKVMNYWMGPFSVNIFIIFLFHPSCGEQGEAEMGKHFTKSFERYLPLWIAPWFEVLFPSQGVSLPQGQLLMPLLFRKRVTLFSNTFSFTRCLFHFGGKRKARGSLKDGMTVAILCALKYALSLSCNGQPSNEAASWFSKSWHWALLNIKMVFHPVGGMGTWGEWDVLSTRFWSSDGAALGPAGTS